MPTRVAIDETVILLPLSPITIDTPTKGRGGYTAE